MKKFRVTVVVLTYNHENYIRQAIQSILDQKTEFDVKIIISNDGSTDKTEEIVKQFALDFPEQIFLISRKENIGIRKSIFELVAQVEGDYLAILDGDDYWSYENKLQKQVDFLDTNPEYNGVFHDALIEHLDTSGKVLYGGKKMYTQSYVFNEDIIVSEIIERKIILPSSSALIRLSCVKTKDWELITDNYSFLWKLTLFAIRNGKFKFLNEPWSVYRNHKGGISKGNIPLFYLDHISFLKSLLRKDFFQFYKKSIFQAIADQYFLLFHHEQSKKHKTKYFRSYFFFSVKRMLQEKKNI